MKNISFMKRQISKITKIINRVHLLYFGSGCWTEFHKYFFPVMLCWKFGQVWIYPNHMIKILLADIQPYIYIYISNVRSIMKMRLTKNINVQLVQYFKLWSWQYFTRRFRYLVFDLLLSCHFRHSQAYTCW